MAACETSGDQREVQACRWTTLPAGVLDDLMNRKGRWIPTLRLICKNWCHEVDLNVTHVRLDGDSLRDRGLKIDIALQVLNERFPRLKSLECTEAIVDWIKPISETFGGCLVSLTLATFSNQRAQHLSGLPNLESLVIKNKGACIRDDVFAHVSSMSRLRTLVLPQCNMECHDDNVLAGLTKLRKFGIQCTRFTTFDFLKPLVQLEELNISYGSESNFEMLTTLKSMKKLNIECGSFNDRAASALTDLVGLTDIDVSFTEVTNDGAKCLATLDKVGKLGLGFTRVTIDALYCFPQLRALRVGSWGSRRMCISPLSCFTQLADLTLLFVEVTDENLPWLTQIQSLTKLSFNAAMITDIALPMLANLGQLETLHANNGYKPNVVLKEWGWFPKLRNLNLRGHGWEDDSLAHLSRIVKLGGLNLHKTKVSDRGVDYLTQLQALTRLEVSITFIHSRASVSDVGANRLSSLTSLAELVLNGTRVSKECVDELRCQLPFCTIFR